MTTELEKWKTACKAWEAQSLEDAAEIARLTAALAEAEKWQEPVMTATLQERLRAIANFGTGLANTAVTAAEAQARIDQLEIYLRQAAHDSANLVAERTRLEAEIARLTAALAEATEHSQHQRVWLEEAALATAREEERKACGDLLPALMPIPQPSRRHTYADGWADAVAAYRAAIRARGSNS